MTERQQIALANAIDPEDVEVLPSFTQIVSRLNSSYATILTVDRIQGGFLWHACAVLLSKNHKAIPLASLMFGERKILESVARELLFGVGEHEEDVLRQEKALQHQSAFDRQ